jgi:hypothetical protein
METRASDETANFRAQEFWQKRTDLLSTFRKRVLKGNQRSKLPTIGAAKKRAADQATAASQLQVMQEQVQSKSRIR